MFLNYELYPGTLWNFSAPKHDYLIFQNTDDTKEVLNDTSVVKVFLNSVMHTLTLHVHICK